MRLEINYKENTAKSTNMWSLNNTLLNNQWVIEEMKKTKNLRQIKMEAQ